MPKEHKFVAIIPEKCVGCGICEQICSLEKEKVFNPLKARIRSARIYPVINVSLTCRLCEDPPCVGACPQDALKKSEENGCGWCIEACEFGAIAIDPEKKVVTICDLCEGEPKCVEWCPENALEFTTKGLRAQKSRIDSIKILYKKTFEEKR